ncbi:patatin-like phospholipase family protein [Cupriavidus sp. CV2]|uniref:patatin-like phospholipase family protein n=1 Tax=Cupriavidus ulmosensis TaxID=3065913 RepID=UPI00296AAEC2|nr:patatin-like phospholipase family protein [Cupriavidus sp. CV2]MDW3680335.1 patatin-like phospholipase family protein [Cupriavidus sp. CV2]
MVGEYAELYRLSSWHILNATWEPCCKLFDYIVGTSTGGIIALALAAPGIYSERPKYGANELVDLYRSRGKDIFRSYPLADMVLPWNRPSYGAEGIETVLHEYFADAKLSAALGNVAVTAYNMDTRNPKIFRSWEARVNRGDDYYMRDLARATSAAPTYFPPALISPANTDLGTVHAVDGGVFANNPSTRALIEAMKHERATVGDDAYFALVSLGTGSLRRTYHYKDTKKWGKLRWARVILDVVFDGVSDNVDEQLDTLLHADTGIGKFFRYQGQLATASDDMDNTSDENMDNLERTAEAILGDHEDLYHEMLEVFRQRFAQRNALVNRTSSP